MIEISEEDFRYIVKRLLDNAKETAEEFRKDTGDEFASGRNEGMYEMLDILQSELEVAGVDLAKIGFDIELVKELL